MSFKNDGVGSALMSGGLLIAVGTGNLLAILRQTRRDAPHRDDGVSPQPDDGARPGGHLPGATVV